MHFNILYDSWVPFQQKVLSDSPETVIRQRKKEIWTDFAILGSTVELLPTKFSLNEIFDSRVRV